MTAVDAAADEAVTARDGKLGRSVAAGCNLERLLPACGSACSESHAVLLLSGCKAAGVAAVAAVVLLLRRLCRTAGCC